MKDETKRRIESLADELSQLRGPNKNYIIHEITKIVERETEVVRASGLADCESCGHRLYEHLNIVLGCDGVYYKL